MNHLYILNFNIEESEMCALEMRRIYDVKIDQKYFISAIDNEVTRSLFTKYKLAILNEAPTLEALLEQVRIQDYHFEDYKVMGVSVPGYEKGYRERCQLGRLFGELIEGEFSLSEPSILLGVCEAGDSWYFGFLHKNTQDWHKHDDMPHHFSTALPIRQARSIVNIAVGNNPKKKLVDPCCGVGTVILEACGLGFDIEGYELHYPVKQGALKNVEYYGYTAPIKRSDMKDITKHYDTAIIDIPYGLFTHVEEEEQQAILNHARHICDEIVLVSNKNMEVELNKAGFTLVDQASVTKQRFVRYILIAK